MAEQSLQLTDTSELAEVLTFILTGAMELTGIPEISILFWDAEAEKFTQAYKMIAGGTLEPYKTQARAQGGRARRIIDERRSIPIFDALQLPDFNPVFIKEGYRASLGVPLLSQGEPIGILYVRDKEPREFSERQIALLEGFARHGAVVAIEKARQYEELKRTYDELKHTNNKVKQTYDELRHTKGLVGTRTTMAWIGMVSANWRHAIEGHAITIEEEIEHLRVDLSQECHDLVDKRIDKIKRLACLIQEKPITPPLSEKEGIESTAVNELLRERLEQLWENEPHRCVQRRLRLELDEATTVRASPEWLRQMFDVLVDNAVKAMVTVPEPRLTVSTRQVGRQVEIAFADTGPGISDDLLARLFHEQIEKSQGEKGLGMGLLMAQTIAQTYRGDIRVESTNSTGTTMVVSLPIETTTK
jgi:signal transduction histidine kinase